MPDNVAPEQVAEWRRACLRPGGWTYRRAMVIALCDTVDALRADLDAKDEALEPFRQWWNSIPNCKKAALSDNWPAALTVSKRIYHPTMAEVRRAAEAKGGE